MNGFDLSDLNIDFNAYYNNYDDDYKLETFSLLLNELCDYLYVKTDNLAFQEQNNSFLNFLESLSFSKDIKDIKNRLLYALAINGLYFLYLSETMISTSQKIGTDNEKAEIVYIQFYDNDTLYETYEIFKQRMDNIKVETNIDKNIVNVQINESDLNTTIKNFFDDFYHMKFMKKNEDGKFEYNIQREMLNEEKNKALKESFIELKNELKINDL